MKDISGKVTTVSDERGMHLTDENLSLEASFVHMSKRVKRMNLERELIIKAAKLHSFDHEVRVLDATAGLGEDSLLLASAGAIVDLYEYDEIIARMLEKSLNTIYEDPIINEAVKRMFLHKSDSILAMENEDIKADIIFLDPMFPKREKSASVKKKFQLIQQLEKPCDNADRMLLAAIKLKPKKIIIKRPIKGENLALFRPDYSICGKAIRYDVILPQSR